MLVKKKHNNLSVYLRPLEKLKKKWSFYPHLFFIPAFHLNGAPNGRQSLLRDQRLGENVKYKNQNNSSSFEQEIKCIKTTAAYITKKTLFKHQNSRLTIILNSNGVSQIKDIYFSITAIEKLINSLNQFCAKSASVYNTQQKKQFSSCPAGYPTSSGLRLPTKLELGVKDNVFLSSTTKVIKNRNGKWETKKKDKKENKIKTKYTNIPRFLLGGYGGYSTILLRCQNYQIPFYNQLYVFDLGAHGLKEKERNGFINRSFFKWSEHFGCFYRLNKNITQKLPNSKQLFTVIRAPFVFKKTREQFCLQRISYRITIPFLSPTQKDFLVQAVRLIKLPVELKIKIN